MKMYENGLTVNNVVSNLMRLTYRETVIMNAVVLQNVSSTLRLTSRGGKFTK
jgi:hypothetical protein